MSETRHVATTVAEACLRHTPGSRYRLHRATLRCCYMTATCKRLLHLSSSVTMLGSCRCVRPLPVVLFSQIARCRPPRRRNCASRKQGPLQHPRKTAQWSLFGLSPTAWKLATCKPPECKLFRLHLYSASHSRVVCKRVGCCPAAKPHRMSMGFLDDVSC